MSTLTPGTERQGSTDANGVESAFPLPLGHSQVRRWQAGHGEYRTTEAVSTGGLTKREYFAAKAMQSVRAVNPACSSQEVAQSAVADADALLKELAK